MRVAFKIAAHMVWICPDIAEVAQRIVAIPVAFTRNNPSDFQPIVDLKKQLTFAKTGRSTVKILAGEIILGIAVPPGIAAGQVQAETILEKRAGNRGAQVAVAIIAESSRLPVQSICSDDGRLVILINPPAVLRP